MALISRLDLRTQVRQRADLVRSQYITDNEINGYLNASIQELYDLLIQKFGEDYFVQSIDLNILNGVDTYALPAEFYKLLGVDLRVNGGDFITMKPFMFSERNKYNANLLRGTTGAEFTKYRIQGNNLLLRPTPISNGLIRLWFVPQYAGLFDDGDLWDGYNGWEEYVIVDCVIKCKAKDESNVSIEGAQKGALIKRIEDVAGNRDAGLSFRVADVRSINNEQSIGFFDL